MDRDRPAEIVFHFDVAENLVRMHSNRHIQPSALRTMYDCDILSDVMLYGAPPVDAPAAYLRPIRAHKSVLASVSRHLYDLFTCHGYRDSHKDEYHLLAVNHESLERIVQLIYTDEIKMTMENIVRVMCGMLVGADYLMMENVAACEKFLIGNQQVMKPENCVEIWCMARKLRRSALMHATSTAIATNLEDLPKDAEFLHMDYDDISTLLQSEALKNADPDRKCAAAIAWLEFDSVTREVFAGSIAGMIPLKFGSVSYDTACKAHACEILRKHAPDTIQKLTAAWQKKMEFTPSVVSSSAYDEKGIWYVMGGQKTDRNSRLFYKYDVARGYWSTLPDLPWERYYFGACATAGHRLIAIGGYKDGKPSLDIDEYDLLAETWSLRSVKLDHYKEHTSAIFDGGNQVYALGGFRTNFIEVYDLISKTVTRNYVEDEQVARAAQYIKVVDADTNKVKCIYSAGGHLNNWIDGNIEKLDISNNNNNNNKWSTVGALLSGARVGVALAIAGDDLYLMGGLLLQPHTDDGISVNSVEIFNTRTGQIRAAPHLLHASFGSQATTAYNDNVVCVLGGMDTKYRELCSVETYDVREGRWSTGTIIPKMPTRAYGFGFAAI